MVYRGDGIPQGWRECPAMGTPMYWFIPMKVPIGNPRLQQHLQPHEQFTPQEALERATELIASRPEWQVAPNGQPMIVGAVLDLTNSTRYYDTREITQHGVYHIKVPCRGRGQSPDPAAVNAAIWEIRKVIEMSPNQNLYILVHCTHGFNRTGYIIVNALMRLYASEGMSVERALRRFAAQRMPGIYKDDYIEDLFRYHHERRPPSIPPAVVPDWKGPSSPPDDEELREAEEREAGRLAEETAPKYHDDTIGELIPREEEEYIQQAVCEAVLAQSGQSGDKVRFPGSQPVSLDRKNMSLIQQKRYYMTWKADGTRYMLLVTHFGVYLIDRSNRVRRVQMRFPTALPEEKRRKAPWPVGPPHTWTLLDGEMVVDAEGEGRQRRRYLVYDIMLLNRMGVMDMRFEDRFSLIFREVESPRRLEKDFVAHTAAKNPAYPFLYEYEREPFSMRRKDFWPLTQAEKVLQRFIPELCHESDGLILQSWDDPYMPQTCHTLLKWKFAHLNSVDFTLVPPGAGQKEPQLLLMRHGANDLQPLQGARISFPAGTNPAAYYNRIVECVWDSKSGTWMFLRDRVDKETPNHINTYKKVWGSIQDNIQAADVLAAFNEALGMGQYGPDVNPQLAQQQHQQHHGSHAGHGQPHQQQFGHPPPQHGQHMQHMHQQPGYQQHQHHQQQPHHQHPSMQPPPPQHHQQQQYQQQQQQRHAAPAHANGAQHSNGSTRMLASPPSRAVAAAADGSHAGPGHDEADADGQQEEDDQQYEGQEEQEDPDAAAGGSSPGSHADDDADDGLDAADDVQPDGEEAVEDDYKVTEAASGSEVEED